MTYIEFIEQCKNRILPEGIYAEKHHIVPRCMGGSNSGENLIVLSGQEHYMAHKLLAIENPDIVGLQAAWWHMCTTRSKKGIIIISADEYAEAKENWAKRASIIMSKMDHTGSHNYNYRNPYAGRFPPKKVRCIETGIVYISGCEAARQTGLHDKDINLCCRGKRKTAGGFHWEFV